MLEEELSLDALVTGMGRSASHVAEERRRLNAPKKLRKPSPVMNYQLPSCRKQAMMNKV